MMNHAQLRAFHAVASTGSFTAAAERLRVSQPAVTMQVKALEEAHGVELFRRRGRRVEQTDLGQALADLTRRLFGIEEEVEELLGAARKLRRGRLRVGADAPYHVIGLLAAFRESYPDLTISLGVGNSSAVLRDVLDGKSDVAVLAEVEPDPRIHAVPCGRHRLIAFVARQSRWGKRKRIRLADLEGEPMILREVGSITRRTLESALAAAGVRPHVVMEIGSREAVREAVAAGLGIGVVSEAELGQDARLTALAIEGAGQALENTEYVVCLSERRKLRLVQAFFDLAAARFSEKPAG
jgi:LysR family transcriptional regulator, low CO2-responsive transcriptional regulator